MIVVEKNGMYTTWVSEIGAFNTKLEKEKYGMHYTDDELQVIANEFSRCARQNHLLCPPGHAARHDRLHLRRLIHSSFEPKPRINAWFWFFGAEQAIIPVPSSTGGNFSVETEENYLFEINRNWIPIPFLYLMPCVIILGVYLLVITIPFEMIV